MTREDFYRNHTLLYFITAGIGGAFCYIGHKLPIYNETTGEILKPYSTPFLIVGAVLIVFSFIGLVFFCDAENDFLI